MDNITVDSAIICLNGIVIEMEMSHMQQIQKASAWAEIRHDPIYYVHSAIGVLIMFGVGFLPPIPGITAIGMKVLGAFLALRLDFYRFYLAQPLGNYCFRVIWVSKCHRGFCGGAVQ